MDRRSPARASLDRADPELEGRGFLFRFLSNRTGADIWGLALAMIFGLAMVDFLTGPELGLSPFYLLPILALAWSRGTVPAVVASLISAGMWLAADVVARHQPLQAWVHLWNVATRLSLFLIAMSLVVQLRRAHAKQEEAARTDPLTGIANSREFGRLLGVMLGRARERGIPMSFAYIDVDRFKQINDALGHSEGDRVLREIARILRRSLRSGDILARLGGDEFGVALLGETEQASIPLDRARRAITEEIEPVHPTVSIGLATFHQAPASVDEMIRAADELMYEVKESGRDQLKQRLISADRRSRVSSQ